VEEYSRRDFSWQYDILLVGWPVTNATESMSCHIRSLLFTLTPRSWSVHLRSSPTSRPRTHPQMERIFTCLSGPLLCMACPSPPQVLIIHTLHTKKKKGLRLSHLDGKGTSLYSRIDRRPPCLRLSHSDGGAGDSTSHIGTVGCSRANQDRPRTHHLCHQY